MKKYSKPEMTETEIESMETLLTMSDLHDEESDGTSPMSLEIETRNIWDVN